MTSTQTPGVIPVFDLKDRCKKARESGGFKDQQALSDASRISVRTISRYESGETKKPNRSVMAQWALACGVPFEWLMYGDIDLRESTSDEGTPSSRWTIPELLAA